MGVETTGYSSILCVGPRRGQLATVGRDDCARGREWQQLGQQQQQGRDPQRPDSLSRMLRGHSDRSATPPGRTGRGAAAGAQRSIGVFLLPSLQSDEFLERAILSYKCANSPPWAIQRSLPLCRRLHCCCCRRHSFATAGRTILVVMMLFLYQCFSVLLWLWLFWLLIMSSCWCCLPTETTHAKRDTNKPDLIVGWLVENERSWCIDVQTASTRELGRFLDFYKNFSSTSVSGLLGSTRVTSVECVDGHLHALLDGVDFVLHVT